MANEREIIFQKEYDTKDHFIGMFYERSKENSDEVLYRSEVSRKRNDAWDEYEEIYGVYCPKCGTLHEYKSEEYEMLRREHLRPGQARFTPCESCGKETLLHEIVEANGTYLDSVIAASALRESVPRKLSIATEGDHINISVILRRWGFNAKASKPYRKDYQITIVINTKLGQTYVMPAKWKNELSFRDMDGVRTASFSYNGVLSLISDNIFKGNEEALAALSKAFSAHRPEMKGDYSSLVEVTRANYLGPLYSLCTEREPFIELHIAEMWKTLRRRYVKNPETFPKYLTYGCKEVSTKSIRKILYKHPDEKWTLLFLHKTLGLTNCDVIRNLMTDESGRTGVAADYINFFTADGKTASKQIRHLADALSEAGMDDKRKASYFLSTGVRYHQIRDSARMYEMYERYISKGDLLGCKTINDLHELLVETDLRRRNKVMWDRYHEEMSYTDNILSLEGRQDCAEFKIIKCPWDLKALGQRFHNCVGSYMEDVKQKKSVIVEMLLNGKSEACIELDGTGKTCLQAFAACNRRLEGAAAEMFDKWTKDHGIVLGRLVPRAANPIMDVRAWDIPQDIPF